MNKVKLMLEVSCIAFTVGFILNAFVTFYLREEFIIYEPFNIVVFYLYCLVTSFTFVYIVPIIPERL